MTYAVGQTIAALDFNSFSGTIGPAYAYANDSAATNAVSALIGVGYGSRGYGQTSTSLSPVVSGNIVRATEWNQLFAVLSILNIHTGSALTLPSNVAVGDVIQALDGSSSRPHLSTIISTLDSNRLLAASGQTSLSSVLNDARSTSWNTTIYHEFTMAFSNENQARYFFNSGGQVYASASRTGGSAWHLNNTFTAMLSSMGTIKMSATSTTFTGTGGIASNIGYYGLTGTYQNLFVSQGTTYGYASASYNLQARVESVVGANGGNGSLVRFRAVFSTGVPSYDLVDGTVTSYISQLAPAGVLTIAYPGYTTTSSL